MKETQKVLVEKERTVHMYAELWHASKCVLTGGMERRDGSTWEFLSSIVLTAFAFEAYMNHVGDRTFQCWDKLDRLSPWAKFELLCEKLQVSFPEGPGARPLQTVSKLLEFRNTIAHGRTRELSPKPEVHDVNSGMKAYWGESPLLEWEILIRDCSFAQRAREDVEKVLGKLHDARKDDKECLFAFGMGSHSATLIREP